MSYRRCPYALFSFTKFDAMTEEDFMSDYQATNLFILLAVSQFGIVDIAALLRPGCHLSLPTTFLERRSRCPVQLYAVFLLVEF